MDKLDVDNDIRVIIKSKNDGILFDQECCTVINLILNNDGEIATSFLGVHNEQLLKALTKVQKAYFKALKKTLKEERKATSTELKAQEDAKKDCDCSDNCTCEENCNCDSDNKCSNTCDCDTNATCNCDNKEGKCTCGDACDCNTPKAKEKSKSKKQSDKSTDDKKQVVNAVGNNCCHSIDGSGKPIAKAKLETLTKSKKK